MLSFDDVKKNARRQMENDKKREDSKKSDWESVKKQARDHIAQSGMDFNSWFSGVHDLSRKAGEYFSRNGYIAPNTAFDSDIEKYLANAGAVKSYINANQGAFANHQEVSQAYEDAVSHLADLKEGIAKANEHFSKFKNEDDYNTAVRHYGYQQKYSGKSYEEIQSVIGTLSDGEEKEWLSTYQYELLPTDVDFDSKSTAGWEKYLADQQETEQAQKEARENESLWDKLGRWLGPTGTVDTSIPLGNAPEITHNLSADTSYLKPGQNWTDDQKGVYGYLYDADKTAAGLYAKNTTERNNQAENAEKIAAIEAWATKNGWTGSAATLGAIAMMPLSLADTLSALTEYNAKGFVSTSATPLPGQVSNAITGAISTVLNEKSGTISEKAPVIGGKGLGDAYQLGTSIANSMITAHTQGPLGTYLVFFGSASASGMYDAKNRGATDSQAITLGILNGLAEAAGEAFSAEKLLGLAGVKELKSFFANILLQAGIEASEEGVTTLLNTFADKWVMKDKSNYGVTVSYYMNEKGMSREEAEKQANKDWLNDIAFDMLGGFISGASSAGLQTGVQTMFVNHTEDQRAKEIYGVDPGALVSEALEINPDNAFAQKMQGRLDNGKNLSGGQLNRLVQQNEAALTAQDMSSIQSAAESRLAELGETGDVSAIAAALTKRAAGVKLSRAEQQAIANSKYGQRVANELNTENIKSGDYSSEWAENIGTERINPQEYSRLVEAAQLPQETADVTGEQVVPQPTKAAQVARAAPVDIAEAPAANDRQMTGKLTGKESLQVAEESKVTEEDVSVEGKTFQKSTGKPVAVKRFSTVGGGEAIVITDSDAEVSMSDVSFGSEGEAVLMESIASFEHVTTEAANTILQAFRSNSNQASAVSFTAGAAHIFKSGYYSTQPSVEYTSKLSQNQVDLIYNAGREAAREHYRAEQEKVDAKKKAAAVKKATTKNGGVYYGYDGQTIDQRKVDESHKELTKAQSVGVDFVKRMADKFGMTVYFYESYKDADGNRVYRDAEGNVVPAEDGFYNPNDGSIHIDLNAGSDGDGKILFVIAHELVHHIKEQSPAHFKAMADIVVQGFTSRDVSLDKLIADEQAAAAEHSRTLTEDEAFEEVVARSMEGILADGKVLELMSKIEAKNKSLGDKVKQFFRDVAKLIWDTIDAYRGVKPDSVEGRMIMRMEDVYNRLQEVFAEGVYEAGTTFQEIEKNTNNSGGSKVKFANRISLLTDEDILELIENCNRGEYALRTFIPVRKDTPNILLEKSKLEGLKPLENRPVIMLVEHVQQCMDDDVAAIDGKRGHALTAQNILDITKSLDDPKYIFFQQDNERYSLVVEYDIGTRNERGMAIVDVTRDKNPDQMNGFEGGKYNILVTAYAPDSEFIKKYIKSENNKCIYNKTEDDPQGSSGSLVPSLLNGSSSNSTLAQPETVVKEKDSTTVDAETIDGILPDIRYASRQDIDVVTDLIRKENENLRSDVGKLKELLKLQRTVTNGTKFTPTSVEAAARLLKKQSNATGPTSELADLLSTFYEYIATERELTWEGVKEHAQDAVDWLQDHVKQQRSEYAQDILEQLHGSRIYLDESQKAEAAHRFGSFNDFRRSVMGSVIVANDAKVSLDSLWHEMSTLYPYVFDPELSASDMPGALSDIIDQLRNEDTSLIEYEYNRELITQNLIRQVYDSYWNVSTLRTFADVKQAQINRLKGEHIQRMNKLKAESREKIEQIKAEHRVEVDMIRSAYRQKLDKQQKDLSAKYQESRKRDVDSRHRTVMRHKISKVVNDLNQYLLHGTKERHVPIELQKAVAEALDAVNMDTVGAEERIAKLEADLLKAKTPEQIQEISRKIDHIRAMGDRMNGRLQKLKDAYDQFVNSDDPLIANSHDEVISNKLQAVIDSVGDTALRDMNLTQLEDVYDMYRMVLTTIRNANKAFKAKKGESITAIATEVMAEVKKVGGKKQQSLAMLNGIKEFGWNNLKPVYAFEHIGSDHFTEVFNNVRAGEDVWAVDVTEARAFYLDKAKKHNYNSWDFSKRHRFESSSGMAFELDLEQIMSLYAYSKRDQAADHLRRGGIVFDESTKIVKKTKLGLSLEFNPTEATAYNISTETLADIVSKLTDEQRAFVDEMQEYLSTVMGEKGNAVSLEMYGVKLFKEKFYFPLKSAQQFMAKAKEQQKGEVKIKNSGFSKETVQKASNPIVLTPFMNVWADHVNEMSMYHAFVLPMEDFYRVYNFKTATSETEATESVEMFIQNAYGKGATKYIDQLLKDLNGGARVDSTTGIINKGIGLFKKGAVFASLSVVVQQPSSVARASALVDTKYFIGPKVDHKRHTALWDEVKKYAPVAIIKEMGYFDTNMGKSTQDFILGKEYGSLKEKMTALVKDSNYRDDILSKAPALADEIAWCGIWEAVKREQKAKNPGMDVKSEAFLKMAGERFTEVIVKTQVYDSVLSRSGMMRSKDTGMKMATAFMAEPTTSINMVADALLQGKRGNRKYARAAIGAVIASQILNAILVSFVYAGRDDDEEETYIEKYIGSVTGEILDSLNPAGYIPFLKDIVSIVQGYEVERSDMSVISDLWKAWENLGKDNISTYRKAEGFAGSIAQIFGLPVKNIMRDARGIYQTVMSFVRGEHTTAAGIGHAVKSTITGKDVSNGQQLYEAYLSGDEEQLARITKRYEDEKAVSKAMSSAIKEHYMAGDIDADTATQYLEGYCGLSSDDAYWKVDAWKYASETGSSEDYSKYGDFYIAVETGKNLKAVIKEYTDNGVPTENLASQITSHFKPLYIEMAKSERASINGCLRNAMIYCGMNETDATERLRHWNFIAEFPDCSDLSESAVTKYYESVKSSGISVSVYYKYCQNKAGYSKKDDIMNAINDLPITSTQKDSLYFAEGWAASKLHEAPWH